MKEKRMKHEEQKAKNQQQKSAQNGNEEKKASASQNEQQASNAEQATKQTAEQNQQAKPEPSEEERKQFEAFMQQIDSAMKELDDARKKAESKLQEAEKRAEVYQKDLERFKERNKNVETELSEKITSNLVKALLPILDNFEHAFSAMPETEAKGIRMIYEKLQQTILDYGIEIIPAQAGTEFNPNLHNAVMNTQATNPADEGKIAQELQKGYKFVGENGKIIRHSTVVVYA